MTPREVDLYQRGFARRRQDDWKRALWAAWNAEAFARTKRLPNLRKMLAQIDRAAEGKGPGKTVDEILASIQAAHGMLTAMADRKTGVGKKGGKKERTRG